MSKLNYSEKIDKHFPSFFKYRSLRSVFDPLSSEWSHCDVSTKLTILKNIIKIEPLDYWVNSYSQFYTSIKKEYVVREIPEVLLMFLVTVETIDEKLALAIKEYLLSGKIDYFYAFNNLFSDKLPHQVLGDDFLEANAPYITAIEHRKQRAKEFLAKIEMEKELKKNMS